MNSHSARHIRIDTSVLQAKLWHEAGISALAADKLEDAVRAFRHAVSLNPRHDAAWNDLGVVMEALGNPIEAMNCYRTVLKLRPDHEQARENLGMLWFQVKAASMLSHQAFSASHA